jgi:hypothetical protein
MKLTDALKKSNVQTVKRASQGIEYQAVDDKLFALPVTDDSEAVKLGLADLTATDWMAKIVKESWIGSKEKEETNP